MLPRRDYFFSLSLSLFLSPLFPRSPFTHERVKEKEEWEEDTIRYDTIRYRVGELKTETRFCGGGGGEEKIGEETSRARDSRFIEERRVHSDHLHKHGRCCYDKFVLARRNRMEY